MLGQSIVLMSERLRRDKSLRRNRLRGKDSDDETVKFVDPRDWRDSATVCVIVVVLHKLLFIQRTNKYPTANNHTTAASKK